MPGLLVIAHAPLASALKAVAEHTFPNCAPQLAVLDVQPSMSAEAVEAAARELLAGSAHTEWLVLTDVFGATPSNAALRLLDEAGHIRLVSGVNVSMLWRSLCYAGESLERLVQRASEGGAAGIVVADLPVNPYQSPESP